MPSKNPGYITQNRLGIWYFQLRIPKKIRDNHPDLPPLVRKSLKTRNRREALKLARKHWVRTVGQDYQITDIKQDLDRERAMIERGRELIRQLEADGITETDTLAIEAFLDDCSSYDFQCFFKAAEVPWARKGNAFTLLFEQAALALVREMPVNAAARIIEITDKRLWRIVEHYVDKAVARFDLSDVKAIGLNETASKRGHNYVTVFIDMEKGQEPVLFVTSGKGKEALEQFSAFLEAHKEDPAQIREAVCDMSPPFLGGVAEALPNAQITVDWFHIVQTFTRALDDVRKREARVTPLPKHLRWSVLKQGDADHLTKNQLKALAELLEQGLDTATAWRVKERLRWIRLAKTLRAAKWRITRFLGYARELVGDSSLLEPVRKALVTLEKHAERVVRRWTSTYTNARMEGLNSLFQAARARARGYRNNRTFMSMIYMIASPAGSILKSI